MSPRVLVVVIAALVFGSGAWSGVSRDLGVSAAGHVNLRASHAPQTGVWKSRHLSSMRLSSLTNVHARSANQPLFRGSPASRPKSTPKPVAQPTRPLIPANPPVVYNGLNKPGMTPGLATLTPPDSTGAIGPANYIEFDNVGVTVYDRNTLVAQSSVSLDTFAGAPGGTPLCDPQIEWDPSGDRWLYSILICDFSSSTQGITVGWSRTSNPADGWCNGQGFNLTPFVLDFQKLGHNANHIIIGGNFYDLTTPSTNPPFVGAEVLWTPMPTTGDTNCPSSLNGIGLPGPLTNWDSTLAFTPVPVNTDSNASDGYVFAAYDPAGNAGAVGPRSMIAAFHLDSAGVFHHDPDIGVTSYRAPTPAPEADGGAVPAHLIDTLDARLTQVEGNPTTGMYMQHTVLDPSNRSEVDWYEVTGSGSALTLVQQGAIDTTLSWTYNAAISPRSDGQGAAIFYNVSNSGLDPKIVAQIRRPTTTPGSFESGTLVLALSSAADQDFSCNNPTAGIPCRWGDYAAATPDPTKPYLVWGTGEINTAGGSNPGWADQNYAVVAAVKPLAPINVHATSDGRGDALVTWAPVNDGGSPVRDYEIDAFRHGSPTPFAHVNIKGALAAAGQFQGLTGGTTYSFEVRTETLYGTSDFSLMSNAITITGVNQSTSASPPPRSLAAQSTPTPPPTR